MTAAFTAAVIVFVSTPPRPLRTASAADASGHVLRGAFHIHTTQSDGALDRRQIALAASQAGMHFAIFTDHGDGTRPPQAPEYLHGVLCMDGVEVSTNQGHYVALGLPAVPYPLGGDADAVAEDVARLGGFGIAAHPFSRRPELAWQDWNVPVDGIEWLNADSEWRDESRTALTRALLGYLTRPGGALASLLDRPEAALAKLDELAARRHVVAVAGHDAHGGFGEENGERGRRLHLPSYEAAFRTFSVNVQVHEALKGRAVEDALAVLEAIRRGRVFTAVDAIASPAALDFGATDGSATAVLGDVLPDNGHEVRFLARAAMPAGASLVLLRDGAVVSESPSNTVEYSTRAPGSYRVEVRVAGAPGTPPIPWIVSSPIFRFAAPRGETPPAAASTSSLRAIAAEEWHLEKGGGTTAAFSLSDGWRGSDLSTRHQSESIRGTGRRPAVGARRFLGGRLQGPSLQADAHLGAAPLLGGRGNPVEEIGLPQCQRGVICAAGLGVPRRRSTRDDAGHEPGELNSVRHRHDEREARRRGQFHDSGRRAAPVRGVRHGSDPCLTRLQVFTVRNMKPEAPRTMMLGDQAASQGVRRPLLPSATKRLVTIQ